MKVKNAELERVIEDCRTGKSIVTPDNVEALLRYVYQLGSMDGYIEGVRFATTPDPEEGEQL